MSDFLKSAMGYFNAVPSAEAMDNDFVGQVVDVGQMKLLVKRVIAEGKKLIFPGFFV